MSDLPRSLAEVPAFHQANLEDALIAGQSKLLAVDGRMFDPNAQDPIEHFDAIKIDVQDILYMTDISVRSRLLGTYTLTHALAPGRVSGFFAKAQNEATLEQGIETIEGQRTSDKLKRTLRSGYDMLVYGVASDATSAEQGQAIISDYASTDTVKELLLNGLDYKVYAEGIKQDGLEEQVSRLELASEIGAKAMRLGLNGEVYRTMQQASNMEALQIARTYAYATKQPDIDIALMHALSNSR